MISFYFVFFITLVAARSFNDTSNLFDDIFSTYNREIRPGKNHSESVNVTVKFQLHQLKGFHELEGTLSTIVTLEVYWSDHRVKWKPSAYNGIQRIYVRQKYVWLPEIYSTSSMTGMIHLRNDNEIVLYEHNGSATWHSFNVFETTCRANTINYPFDKQSCELFFIPFINDNDEILLTSTSPAALFSDDKTNGEWTVISVNGSAMKYEHFSWLHYTISFKREAGFFVITLLVPVCLLGLLNIFVFVIPAESGERIGYGVTLLLAIGVYLSILSEDLPKSANPQAAKICYKLASDIAMAAAIMISTIISLVFYHKDENSKVPEKVVTLVKFLGKAGCCKSKVYHQEPSQITSNRSETVIANGTEADDKAVKDMLKMSKQEWFGKVVCWKDFALSLDVLFLILFFLWVTISNIYFIISVLY